VNFPSHLKSFGCNITLVRLSLTASPHLRRRISKTSYVRERPINMYCRICGKEVSLHAAFCRHCGSKVAIKQAIPLSAKEDLKMRKILALSALGVICFAALIYLLSGGADQIQSETSLPVSSPTATPSEAPTLGEAATPSAGRSVKAQSKTGVATESAQAAGSAQLNSAASPATAPIAETAPARSIAPKRKQVEETFYITKTGTRYHRGGCHHLRPIAYPITRAEAEAQGYTPCRVCYP
jgi:DNA-directed RNA polymerase subunit RPC12/RpoP